jgi:hypothetical protein
MPSFIGNIVSGVGNAIGTVVSGVVDAVGTVTKALGPVGTIAAAYFGMPYLAPTGFAALEAPSILAGTGSTLTGAGMLTSSSLGTALGTGGMMAGTVGAGAGLGSSLASSAGSIGTSSSFLTNVGRGISNALEGFGSSGATSALATPSTGPTTGGLGSLSKVSNLIRGGMDIYNALNYGQGQTPTAAQQSADPYAPYRQQAADKLNALMQNPNMVYGMPGYKFAQEQGSKAINRSAASQGSALSGNTLLALQNQGQQTAQSWFDDYVNKLSTQAGANQAPAAGQEAYTTAAKLQSSAEKNRQTALLQGIMSTGSAIGSFFG